MTTYAEASAAAASIVTNSSLLEDVVTGADNATVTLGGEAVKTVANAIKTVTGKGTVIGFATKTAMDADLAHGAGTIAGVLTGAEAGYAYLKTGASGAGSWELTSTSFFTDTVANANAIAAVAAYTESVASGLPTMVVNGYIPLLTDTNGNATVAVDAESGELAASYGPPFYPGVTQDGVTPLVLDSDGKPALWYDHNTDRLRYPGDGFDGRTAQPWAVQGLSGGTAAYLNEVGELFNPGTIGQPHPFTKSAQGGSGLAQQVHLATGAEVKQLTMLIQDAYNPVMAEPGVVKYALADGTLGTARATINSITTTNDIDYIPLHGQSLSLGSNGTTDVALLCDEAVSDRLLTFNGGFKAAINNVAYSAGDFTSLVSAIDEKVSSGGQFADTGAIPMGFSLLKEQPRRIASATFGHGGQPYTALKQGTQSYTNLLYSVEQVVALKGSGNTARVPGVLWRQGESEALPDITGLTPAEIETARLAAITAYDAVLKELQGDLDTDISALTSQTAAVKLFTQQINWANAQTNYVLFGPGVAQLETELTETDIHCIGPQYPNNYYDAYHMHRESYLWMGSLAAKVMRKVIYENSAWKPMHPVSAKRYGRFIELAFYVPKPPMVVDTSWVTNPGNWGIVYKDDSASATVARVTQSGPTTVLVELTAQPTGANPYIGVGYYGTSTMSSNQGRTTGLRTNLRDSDNEGCVVTGRPLYNWCCSRRVAVTTGI